MRSILIASILAPVAGFMLLAASPAHAAIAIAVDKDAQMMTVAIDGATRYRWPVSSGNPSHETPNGSFRAFRMEEDHYSKEFDEAPMPHAIFFTKTGHAIHGTDSVSRLGSPASHGCVRLSRANASTLWDLVKAEGVLNTTVSLTGSSTVALARNPRPRTNVATARGGANTDGTIDPSANASQPLPIAPQRQQVQPGYGNPYGNSNQAYADPSYYQQDQAYYGEAGSPNQAQRRAYPAPPGYQRQVYEQDAGYQRPLYAPRRGYYYGQ